MNKNFASIQKLLDSPTLSCSMGELLDATDAYLGSTCNEAFRQRWNTLRDNHDLMLHYVRQGIDDPQRTELYRNMLRSMYTLMLDMAHFEQVNSNRSYALAHSRSASFDATLYKVKAHLEDFVTSLPMLELEEGEQRELHKSMLHKDHQNYVNQLFDYLVVSSSWAEPDADFYVKMLTGQTIDSRDARQIVSALTLSAADVFDIQKLRVLCRVATLTTDESLRQRALVGFVLAADDRFSVVYPELADMAHALFAENSPLTVTDLVDLQIQLLFCVMARQDTETLNNDIIPELVNNSSLKMKHGGGIEEVEEDPMDDIILGNKASEERMAKLEESIDKMRQMEQAGSDIYFGGFSQMKRFPFFYRLSNWFCPFYADHPVLRPLLSGFGGMGVPTMLSEGTTPFCDSDRYSFFIALSSLFSRLPADIREMLSHSNGEALGVGASGEAFSSPAFIRRMYLQDLYRFFEIYGDRADFSNLFGSTLHPRRYLPVANGLFAGMIEGENASRLCNFLFKKHRFDDLLVLLSQGALNLPKWQQCYYRGVALMRNHDARGGYDSLQKAWHMLREGRADNGLRVKLLRMLGRAAMAVEEHDEACRIYAEALEANPADVRLKTSHLLALIAAGHTSEALAKAYELSFDDETSMAVRRAYAWALLNAGKTEAALREYKRFVKSAESDMGDLLNASYCALAENDSAQAVDLMSRFLLLWRDSAEYAAQEGSLEERLQHKLEQDQPLFRRLGFGRPELALLVEIVIDKVEEEFGDDEFDDE